VVHRGGDLLQDLVAQIRIVLEELLEGLAREPDQLAGLFASHRRRVPVRRPERRPPRNEVSRIPLHTHQEVAHTLKVHQDLHRPGEEEVHGPRLVVLPHNYRTLLESPLRRRPCQTLERPPRHPLEEAEPGELFGRYTCRVANVRSGVRLMFFHP
jgi:hypothetical protein